MRRKSVFLCFAACVVVLLAACQPSVIEVEVTREVQVTGKEVPVTVEVEVIKEVEVEVTREVEVVKEIEVTRLVEVEAMQEKAPLMVSSAPAFFLFDGENPNGNSHVIRADDSVTGGFTTTGLTPGHAMTLWFIVFNYPEKCVAGPFECGPDDLGVNMPAQGDFVYIPGAGAVIPENGTISMSGTVEVGDFSGSGLLEFEGSCLPGAEDCGGPMGIINPAGALIIPALHSHGPSQSGADLEYQLASYLGGCDGIIGTIPGGFSASPEEIPDQPGECATIQISPHAPDTAVAVSDPDSTFAKASHGPAFFLFDAENPAGNSHLIRTVDGVQGGFTTTDLTPGYAMTLWFILFNYPEKCVAGPFECGPDDLGANMPAQGDFLYIPGAGQVIGEDGTATFSGSIPVGTTAGSGLSEFDGGCLPGAEGCGGPTGLLNPEGALIITAIHSHGPAVTGADLEYQLASYLGECEAIIGTIPGGFAANPDEIPDQAGECATLQISPQAP